MILLYLYIICGIVFIFRHMEKDFWDIEDKDTYWKGVLLNVLTGITVLTIWLYMYIKALNVKNKYMKNKER